MNDERLIELVRKYSVIYDLSHPKYMDTSFKQDIWNNQIGKELKVNGSLCKTRWNNIRDNYRRSLKRRMTKYVPGTKKVKHYKYSEQLSFLAQYFEHWETEGNIENEEDIQYHEIEYEVTEEITENDPLESNISDMGENIQSQPSSPNCLPSDFTDYEITRKPPKIVKRDTLQSASSKLLEYLIYNKEQATTSVQHPVDAFLAGVAPSLKTFTPYYFHLAKSDIFATVQKFEMKMLMEQQRRSDPKFNHTMTPYSEYVYSSTLPSSVSTQLPSPSPTFQEDPTFEGLTQILAPSAANLNSPDDSLQNKNDKIKKENND